MSNRTAESIRAISIAWEEEYNRVLKGKGTRDWTLEQQQDILARGKAYDENGKAFEGQHMRSVEKYPKYQGDPKNIQFLTRSEHLDAHDGSWTNHTNWFYDPKTKKKYDFHNGPIKPCEIIKLSNPIGPLKDAGKPQLESKIYNTISKEKYKLNNNSTKKNKAIPSKKRLNIKSASASIGKIGQGIVKNLKPVGRFIVNNKEFIIVGVDLVINATEIISSIKKGANSKSAFSSGSKNSSFVSSSKNKTNNINYPKIRLKPIRHMVSRSGQHYNTKNGRKFIIKDAYPRGGKH